MSDLEIAKQIELKHIKTIAEKLGLHEDDIEMYGKYKLSPKMDELKLVNSWEEIMGPLISKNTNKIYVNKNVLYLYVSNAPLKHELNFNKAQIIKIYIMYF